MLLYSKLVLTYKLFTVRLSILPCVAKILVILAVLLYKLVIVALFTFWYVTKILPNVPNVEFKFDNDTKVPSK